MNRRTEFIIPKITLMAYLPIDPPKLFHGRASLITSQALKRSVLKEL